MSKAVDTLTKARNRILINASSGAAYASNWSNEFRAEEINVAWNNTKDVSQEPLELVTLDELRATPLDVLYGFSFGNWDSKGLLLIPLWAFHYIGDGELSSISGDKTWKSDPELDLDHRGGCIAWGFVHPALVPEELP